MRKLFTVVLSLISFLNFAQNETSLLYKISGNGISKPSYLFGTIHISCDAKLDDATLKALDETTQLYLELDIDDPEMSANLLKTMVMKDGVTLNSLFSDADYKFVDHYLIEKMQVSASLFNNYKPFILSSMFMNTLLNCQPESYETELMKISNLQKEPIYGLETVEEQMAIFDEIPYKIQAQELLESMKNDFKDDKIELNLMLIAYQSEDLNEIERLISSSKSAIMTDYEDLFLNKRNKK